MAALVAEAEIVWEIDKWERFRIIYPHKPEMQHIPPGSLAPATDHDDMRDHQVPPLPPSTIWRHAPRFQPLGACAPCIAPEQRGGGALTEGYKLTGFFLN